MITPELISYIENQLKKSKKKEDIISRLVYAGWYREDIDEGFSKISSGTKPFSDIVENIKPVKKIEEPKEEFIPNLMSKNPIVSELKDNQSIKDNSNIKDNNSVDDKDDANIEPLKEQEQEQEQEQENELELDKSIPIIDFELLSKLEAQFSKKENISINTNTKSISNKIDSVSKRSIISTYEKDKLNASLKEKKHKSFNSTKIISFIKWSFILILFASIVFAGYFVYSKGYIDFKNIPIIGGDSNKILLKSFNKIETASFYKKESDITIKSSGNIPMINLINNELTSNLPTELKIHTVGVYDRINSDLISFDNLSTVESQSWVNKGTINWKYNNGSLFVPIEHLMKVIEISETDKKYAELDDSSLDSLLSEIINEKLNKNLKFKDIFTESFENKIASNISNLYTNDSSLEFLEKDKSVIRDIEVRYFEVIPSDLNLNNILGDLAEGEKVDSLEFWTDKDTTLFKYKIVFSIPVSYASTDVSSVEQIKIEFSSTFYDLNSENSINLPEDNLRAEDLMVHIEDIDNKKLISSFKILADNFYNISNSYGKKSNPLGDCINSTEGSIFSPSGHSQNVEWVTKDIKNKMDEFNSVFGENIYCYSTSGTWAISIPSKTDLGSYWCTDNLGVTIKTENKPSSAVCK